MFREKMPWEASPIMPTGAGSPSRTPQHGDSAARQSPLWKPVSSTLVPRASWSPIRSDGRGHSTRPGACHSVRGRSTPSGTGFLSPNAQLVPAQKKVHPCAQNVPRRRGMPLIEGRMRCGRCGTARSRLASGQIDASRAATSSSCTAISVKSRSRSRVRTWKRCPVSVQVSRIGGSTAVWA